MNKKIQDMVEQMLDKIEETKSLPWDDGFILPFARGFPRNGKSKKPYRGFNALFLAWLAGSRANVFYTFKQVQEKGGRVKKGAHGVPITFFSWYNKTTKRTWNPKTDSKDDEVVPFWKVYKVFRIEDTTLPVPILAKREKDGDWNKSSEAVDAFISSYVKAEGITYEEKDECVTACYKRDSHSVTVSKKELYHSAAGWYGTVLHELIHSSMKGLKRDLCYDEEEIVAEFGSSLLSAYFGIRTEKEIENTAVYLNSWARKLRSNPQWLFEGAQRAQKAVDYLLAKAGLPSWADKFSDAPATEADAEEASA